MKATHSGPIVGKALESYSASGVDKIMVFVSVGWYVEPIGDSSNPPAGGTSFESINVGNLLATNINAQILMVGDRKLAMTADGSLSIDGSVNILGDASIGGDLKVGKTLSAKEVTTEKLNIASPSAEPGTLSKASTGTETLKMGESLVTIKTSAVTNSSLVFVTPTTVTDKVLSVTKKTVGDSFEVRITSPSTEDIQFNWWVVN
jgi:hypothetical protein